MDGSPVIARGKAAEVLDAVEASLDAIALLVASGVVRENDLVIAFERDHSLRFHLGGVVSQVIAVIGAIGKNLSHSTSFHCHMDNAHQTPRPNI